MKSLRIAMLTHSTLPRGGVVHAMSLCEALTQMGHAAVLHAPDASGAGFSRAPACEVRPFRVAQASADMVAQRIADYVGWFGRVENCGFDIYHAHDGISGAAMAALKPGFVRTVHHIDDFADPRLNAWQDCSIREAGALLTVSEMWRRNLRDTYRREAVNCGNGVDLTRFSTRCDGRERALRVRYELGDDPVFLTVGGVEARKNTLRMLQAFDQLSQDFPSARLVVAGGASLLDHSGYRRQFHAALASMSSRERVVLTGPVDDADMPALYRLARALVFASVKEGFGLCVLEAMACGTPVVVSRAEPFVEYIGEDEAQFCDPYDPASIAAAMREAFSAPRGHQLALAERHSWRAVAERASELYLCLREPVHA